MVGLQPFFTGSNTWEENFNFTFRTLGICWSNVENRPFKLNKPDL